MHLTSRVSVAASCDLRDAVRVASASVALPASECTGDVAYPDGKRERRHVDCLRPASLSHPRKRLREISSAVTGQRVRLESAIRHCDECALHHSTPHHPTLLMMKQARDVVRNTRRFGAVAQMARYGTSIALAETIMAGVGGNAGGADGRSRF